MDDWQDHALSTRHMHNRASRRGSGKSRNSAPFDVRKTFGEYDVKCVSWERAVRAQAGEEQDEEAGLELLRLTSDGQGVLGELVLPGVLGAAVVLAASRRVLGGVTRGLAGEDDWEEEEDGDEDDDEDEDEDEEDEEAPNRFTTFEKNSFRSPKFWLAWNGTVHLARDKHHDPPHAPRKPSSHPPPDTNLPPPSPALHRTGSSFPPPKQSSPPTLHTHAEGLGYLTFTANDCRKFKATLSCSELGWKDVAFSGFKSVSRSESDRQVVWGGRDVETGWRAGERGDGERGARVDARRRVIFD